MCLGNQRQPIAAGTSEPGDEVGRNMGGLQPAGLVGHGEELRFYPKDHGEPLERPEVVCFCRLT